MAVYVNTVSLFIVFVLSSGISEILFRPSPLEEDSKVHNFTTHFLHEPEALPSRHLLLQPPIELIKSTMLRLLSQTSGSGPMRWSGHPSATIMIFRAQSTIFSSISSWINNMELLLWIYTGQIIIGSL